MPTWSDNLKIELLDTGAANWGNLTNNNFKWAIEESITGYATVTFPSDANYDWAALYTNSNSSQAQRNLVLNVVGTLSQTRELIVPTIEKQYIVQNNTTGSQSITVKTSAGTGVTIPNGRKMHVYVDGTNVVQMVDYMISPVFATPTLGVATATSINKVALTAPATSATIAIADNKTFAVNHSLTLAGTDSTTMTFPSTSATIARTDAAQTFTGAQTFSSNITVNSVRVGRGNNNIITNTVLGYFALSNNSTGEYNTVAGYFSLNTNTSGSFNTALGYQTLQDNTSGTYNTAVGYNALRSNQTSNYNTALGYAALAANQTTGSQNVAVGSLALSLNAGSANTGVGDSSLESNTNGGFNTAIGKNALRLNLAGNYNTAVGVSALLATTSSNNTAVGYQAGNQIVGGSGNTIIGYDADSGSSSALNRIVLGREVVGTSNNRITVGSGSNIAELDLDGSDTSWAASSDERLKKNVQTSLFGLDLLNDLRVVTFQWRQKNEIDTSLPYYEDSEECVHGDPQTTYLGFIAQEVQQALANHNAKEVRLVKSRENGILTTAPAALIPVLVRAIQELSAQVKALQSQLK